MTAEGKLKKILEKYRYPLLILLLGAALMLLPRTHSNATAGGSTDENELRLQELLSAAEGVGEARVLVSDSGVLVVCRGADSAQTKLEILRAVSSCTGFGSDKITILKLAGS